MTEVTATGQWSSSSVTFTFLGTGTTVDILKQMETSAWDWERLTVCVNPPASWAAHALRTRLGMSSEPASAIWWRPAGYIELPREVQTKDSVEGSLSK